MHIYGAFKYLYLVKHYGEVKCLICIREFDECDRVLAGWFSSDYQMASDDLGSRIEEGNRYLVLQFHNNSIYTLVFHDAVFSILIIQASDCSLLVLNVFVCSSYVKMVLGIVLPLVSAQEFLWLLLKADHSCCGLCWLLSFWSIFFASWEGKN